MVLQGHSVTQLAALRLEPKTHPVLQAHAPWAGLPGSPRQPAWATPKPPSPAWGGESARRLTSRGAEATSPSTSPRLRPAEVIADIFEC